MYDGYGDLPTVRDVPDPALPDDGVLVDVRATGVCRSDWHAWRGHDPVPLPMVPGHELAGEVAGVGPGVSGWSLGDRVTVPFVVGCGRCSWCLAGEQQVCPDQQQPGFTYPGSWADLVAVPAAEANLVRLPDAVSFVAGAALGCRFATAYRALVTHGRVRPGDDVVVHGCGGAGLSAVMIAAALGAHVVAVDVSAEARAMALDLGAAEALTPDAVAEDSADVSLDCVGSPAVAAASVRSLRRRGRHVQVGLLLGAHAMAPLPMDRVVALELAVHGSHGMPSGQYADLLALLASGAVDPERLVRAVVGLEDAPAALAALDDPAAARGITVVRP
jgi:alcohol dehydrogenase